MPSSSLVLPVSTAPAVAADPVVTTGLRILTLDAWRGLAALLVVSMHAFVAAVYGPYPELAPDLLYHATGLGVYGVQIFFVISGLCVVQAALLTCQHERPVVRFVSARARRLYPPYVIVSVLAIAASLVAAKLVEAHILPTSTLGAERLFGRPAFDYVCSAFLVQKSCGVEPLLPVFWSLCYEAAFYVVVAGLLLIATTWRRPLLLLNLCHALTVGCAVAALLLSHPLTFPFDLWPEFGLGAIVVDLLSVRRTSAWAVGLVVVALQAAFAVRHLGHAFGYPPTPGMQAGISILFACSLVLINPVDRWLARCAPMRLLAWVGTFSYSLYLVHWLAIAPVAQAIKATHLISASTYWVSGVSQVCVAVIAAWIFYGFAEKPFMSSRRRQVHATPRRQPAFEASGLSEAALTR